MSSNTIDAEKAADTNATQAKGKRTSARKAKPTRKPRQPKTASKPKADRTNKKAEVVAMMKRGKGTTVAEIMTSTGWQAHTVRGFVSILGSKGGEKIESTKTADGERTYHIAK